MGLLKIGKRYSKENSFTLRTLFFSESRLEDTRRDFLGKLRSMTGGQVVAVTVDKVYKNKSQPREEKLMDKLKQVSGSDLIILHDFLNSLMGSFI